MIARYKSTVDPLVDVVKSIPTAAIDFRPSHWPAQRRIPLYPIVVIL